MKKLTQLCLLFFSTITGTTFSQTILPGPGVDWQKTYWPTLDECPNPDLVLGQDDSGEDWFYGFCKSYDSENEFEGFINAGYSTYEYIPTGTGCDEEIPNQNPDWGEFETVNLRKGKNWRAKLTKVDANGNELWYKNFGNYFAEFNTVIQGSDGYYYAIGRSNDFGNNIVYNPGLNNFNLTNTTYDPSSPGGSTVRHLYIVKVDQEGNLIWQYVYGDNENLAAASELRTQGYDIVESRPGYFKAVGYNQVDYGGNDKRQHPFIIEINSNGILQWKQSYPAVDKAHILGIDKREYIVNNVVNREYVIAGFLYETLNNQFYSEAFISKINDDQNPGLQNLTQIPPVNGNSNMAFDVTYRANGEVLLPIVFDCNDCCCAAGTATGKIYRYNSSLAPIGTVLDFGTIKAEDLKIGICNTSDGGFAVVSTKQAVLVPDATPPSCPNCSTTRTPGYYNKEYWNTDAYVAKYASNMSMEWETTFDNNSPFSWFSPGDVKRKECMYEITEYPVDGSLVIAGNNTYNFDDDYLVKLQSDCGVKYNYDYIADINNNIYTNTIWDNPMSVKGMVIIPDGVTLTISGSETVIRFADSKNINVKTGITVEPGGRLEIIDGAKLTVLDDCEGSYMWDGIIVEGDATLSQNPVSNQGYLYMRGENTTIEYARNAVTLSGIHNNGNLDFFKTGGIINAMDVSFKNNFNTVRFYSYPLLSSTSSPYYYSIIRDCIFSNDGLMRDPNLKDAQGRRTGINNFISLYGVKMQNISGNTFENITDIDEELNGTGINAYLSTLGCHFNEFTGLTNGIVSASSKSMDHRLIANHNTFTNVQKGVTGFYDSYTLLYNNTFTIPSDVFDPQNPTPPLHPAWGINLNGVEGFRISENQYDAAGVEEEEISYAWGCIIRNSSAAGGWVEKETSQNIAYGIQTEANNPALSINCNSYTNQYFNWSVNPQSPGGSLKDQGEGDNPGQKQAGNLFYDVGANYADRNIRSSLAFTYYAATSPNEAIPSFHSGIVDVQPVPNTDNDDSCPEEIYPCEGNPTPCRIAWKDLIEGTEDVFIRQQLINHLMRSYLDSNLIGDAIDYMETNISLFANQKSVRRQLISTYLSLGMLEDADTRINEYGVETEEDADFISFVSVLLSVAGDERNLFELESSELEILTDLATHETESALAAKVLLKNIKGIDFAYSPEVWEESSSGLIARQQAVKAQKVTEEKAAGLQNEKLLLGSSVEVYPNPAENILNVRYRLAENSRASIKITDAIGRVMEEQKISVESNNAVFALSKYSPGVYTLFLNVEGQVVIVKKIIVQK